MSRKQIQMQQKCIQVGGQGLPVSIAILVTEGNHLIWGNGVVETMRMEN